MIRSDAQPDDPLARPRRLARRWMLAGSAAVPLMVWSLWPASLPIVPTTQPQPAVETPRPDQPKRRPLQLAAFDAPIWTFDPPPPVAAAPPPPLRLQLVGMVRDGGAGGTLKAVVYDLDGDELLVVAEGARVGVRTVTRIDAAGITLTDGHGTRRLLLDPGGAP